MIKVLEFGIDRLAKTSFSREQRSLMSTSTSFAHKSGNYRVNSVACATQLVTPGPTNLAKETTNDTASTPNAPSWNDTLAFAKEATNEVEEENEVHTSTEGVSMQSKGGSSSFSRKDWKKVEDEWRCFWVVGCRDGCPGMCVI